MDFNTPAKLRLREIAAKLWDTDPDYVNPLVHLYRKERGSFDDFCTDLWGLLEPYLESGLALSEGFERLMRRDGNMWWDTGTEAKVRLELWDVLDAHRSTFAAGAFTS